jgi:selenocysteine lyase/cysteine desulfurase
MSALAATYADEFPVRQEYVYFNHAAVSPLPRRTVRAAGQVLERQLHHGGLQYDAWNEGVRDTRRALAELLHADAGEIAFVKNTTQGIIIAAESIPWRAGDNVVTCAIEFPANVYPWLVLERRGVETRFVGAKQGRVALDDVVSAMDHRTRAVALSWVQFSSGFRVDLGKLSALCRERDAYLVVDAIQGLGALELDLSRYAVDFLCADGHKWLLSQEGCGVLYVRKQILDELVPANVGWLSVRDPLNFLDYHLDLVPRARRFEEGTLNMAGVHALGASVGLLLEAGPRQVEAAVLGLTDYLAEGLQRLGCAVTSPRGASEKSGILTFTTPRQPAEEVTARLLEAKVACACRGGAVRFAPHFYNDQAEADRALEVLGGLAP